MTIRATYASIDLDALRTNLRILRKAAAPSAICAVVKANAYGHGSIPVALTLAEEGIEWLAVALVEEGIRLRLAGIKTPILVLEGFIAEAGDELTRHQLTPVLYREDHLPALSKLARSKTPVPFHLKIDTGMTRLGITVDELPKLLDSLEAFPNLKLDGLMTHFANADLRDDQKNNEQLRLYRAARDLVLKRGHSPRYFHAANGAATLESSDGEFNLVRPGLPLYGISPFMSGSNEKFRPVMGLKTRPLQIKNIKQGTSVSYGGLYKAPSDRRIAVLPVGYADGLPRRLSQGGYALTEGERAPFIGAVCMDMAMIDVTDIPTFNYTSEVTLLGGNGVDEIDAWQWATWEDTIPWEITCRIGIRVTRDYQGLPKRPEMKVTP